MVAVGPALDQEAERHVQPLRLAQPAPRPPGGAGHRQHHGPAGEDHDQQSGQQAGERRERSSGICRWRQEVCCSCCCLPTITQETSFLEPLVSFCELHHFLETWLISFRGVITPSFICNKLRLLMPKTTNFPDSRAAKGFSGFFYFISYSLYCLKFFCLVYLSWFFQLYFYFIFFFFNFLASCLVLSC